MDLVSTASRRTWKYRRPPAPIEVTEAPVHLDVKYQKTALVIKKQYNNKSITGNVTMPYISMKMVAQCY